MSDPAAMSTVIDTADVVAVAPVEGVHCVLLIQRHWPPFEGHWALPGGHVDPGEHARDAAARELAEETSIPVVADELTHVGVFDTSDRDPRGPYRTTAYVIEWSSPPRTVAADDARAVRWAPIGGLSELPLAFDHSTILAAGLFTER